MKKVIVFLYSLLAICGILLVLLGRYVLDNNIMELNLSFIILFLSITFIVGFTICFFIAKAKEHKNSDHDIYD